MLGRHGMTSKVADSMASATLNEAFGGVSTKTHSILSRFAAFSTSEMLRSTVFSGSAS